MKLVQSIERALDILEVFTFNESELGLVDISRKTGLSKGTTYRLVYTLVRRGYLRQNSKTGKYHLGPAAFQLGAVAMSHMEIRRVSRSILEDLCEETGETVHLVVEDKGEVLYIDKVDSPQSIRMNSFIGQRLLMHCTAVGKAILAYMDIEDVKRIIETKKMLKHTRNTITTWEDLLKNLEQVREKGYSFDDEENEEGLRCVGAPVRDFTGNVIAAISVSAPSMRLSNEKIEDVAAKVKDSAARISYLMGYRE